MVCSIGINLAAAIEQQTQNGSVATVCCTMHRSLALHQKQVFSQAFVLSATCSSLYMLQMILACHALDYTLLDMNTA